MQHTKLQISLDNRSERSKFETNSAPVLEDSEHRESKIQALGRLNKGLSLQAQTGA